MPNKHYQFLKFSLILILITVWIFFGFPQIFNFPPQIKEAKALDVANGDGLILYSPSANTTPQWRTYTNSTDAFGAETGTVLGATGLNFITRTSPTKQEAIAGYTNSVGTLQVMCYDGTSWTNEWSVAAGGTGTTTRFNISYETNSGDVIVLYSGNVATTNELRFRTKLGSTGCGSANWSAENNLDPIGTSGTVQWVKMAWDKRSTSNLITAIWADSNSDLSAMVWSGTAWGNEPSAALETSLEVVTAAQDVDDFEVQYESTSGDVKVVWANSVGANGTNGVRNADCTGGTATCTWSAVATPPTFTDDATNLSLAGNPNSDEMVFASIGNAGSDLQIGYWSGTAWTNTANQDTLSSTPLAGTHLVSCGWLISGATTRSVCTYNDNNATNGGWIVGSGSTFTTQADITPTPAFGNPQKWYDIQTDPINKDRLMFMLSDVNIDLFAKRVVMNATPTFTWSNADGGAALNANISGTLSGPFSFAYWRFIPLPTFNQSAYRLFNNLDSTDVGTALAAQDTAATLGAAGAAFRLRMLLHIGVNRLAASGETFNLQFAQQSGTCDTGFVGETYADVTAATVIAYSNNATPADGASLTANALDPTHGADTIVNQTYEELNNFTNSVAAIPSGQDGKWDFSLFDNGAIASTAYCLRAVLSTGTVINTYSVIPQITMAASGNSAPTVSSVSLNQAANITLIENTTTSVLVTGTLTDVDGGADISSATATIYRSSVSGVSNCTADDNQCYQIASGSCALGAASGNTKPATCTAGVWFVADATDAAAPTFSADIWSANLTATDVAGAKGSATNSAQSIEVNSLTALDVSASISYGSLAPTSTSASSQIAVVTTTGNRAIDVQFQAVNDMCDTTNCVGGNEITADRQQFATSSIAWSDPVLLGATKLASTSAQTLNLTTTKPTTHADNTSDTMQNTFWRIGIPAGQPVATYNGTTTATAVNGT